eukprot:scaffold3096_cov403-Prasinococcus_capsulatus_cf.AAC.12
MISLGDSVVGAPTEAPMACIHPEHVSVSEHQRAAYRYEPLVPTACESQAVPAACGTQALADRKQCSFNGAPPDHPQTRPLFHLAGARSGRL